MITQVGLSHRTAPIEVRERLTVADEEVVPLLQAVNDAFGHGAALLSTCNRLELYVGDEIAADALHEFLAARFETDQAAIARHFQTRHGLDAVRHLYGVASGVDSMVLGETEVLGQVRASFSARPRSPSAPSPCPRSPLSRRAPSSLISPAQGCSSSGPARLDA